MSIPVGPCGRVDVISHKPEGRSPVLLGGGWWWWVGGLKNQIKLSCKLMVLWRFLIMLLLIWQLGHYLHVISHFHSQLSQSHAPLATARIFGKAGKLKINTFVMVVVRWCGSGGGGGGGGGVFPFPLLSAATPSTATAFVYL